MRKKIAPLLCAMLICPVIGQAAPAPVEDAMAVFLSKERIVAQTQTTNEEKNASWFSRLSNKPSSLADTFSDVTSELIFNAMQLIGVPYTWGGNTVETGLDCSGFVKLVYERVLGLTLPRSSREQARATQEVSESEMRPGDLVFFNTRRAQYSHVGIYIGDNQFIHSPSRGSKVRIENMTGSYWAKRFDGARRVVDSDR